MIGRRSLLRMIGAAPLAASSSSKAMMQAGMAAESFGSYSPAIGVADVATMPGSPDTTKAASWLLANGLPNFVKESLRQERRVPSGLDPDLVANRSFSLSAKIYIQRERNLQRAMDGLIEQQKVTLKKAAWRKVTGIDLWW